MQSKILFFALLLLPSLMQAQHPNTFLSSVFDQQWCTKNNIKEITSQRGTIKPDAYTYIKGVKFSKKSTPTLLKNGHMQQRIGKDSLLVSYSFDKRTNLIRSYSFANVKQSYYYNDDSTINYIIHSSNMSYFTLEEFIRDDQGLLISKKLSKLKGKPGDYYYDKQSTKTQSATLQRVNHYRYNTDKQLIEISINMPDAAKEMKRTGLITVEYKDGLPISTHHYKGDNTLDSKPQKRSYTYLID